MIAVALASSVSAIGFTGIVAFGRSITRAKQFASQTELITAAIRASIASSDNFAAPSDKILTSINGMTQFTAGMTLMTKTKVPMPIDPNRIPTPKNWTVCTIVNDTDIPTIAAVPGQYPEIPGVSKLSNASILVFYLDLDRQTKGFTDTTLEPDTKYLNISNKSTTGNVGKALYMSQISCRNTLTIQGLICVP